MHNLIGFDWQFGRKIQEFQWEIWQEISQEIVGSCKKYKKIIQPDSVCNHTEINQTSVIPRKTAAKSHSAFLSNQNQEACKYHVSESLSLKPTKPFAKSFLHGLNLEKMLRQSGRNKNSTFSRAEAGRFVKTLRFYEQYSNEFDEQFS